MRFMNPEETKDLIDAVGGDAAFARFLGIDEGGFAQRVNNWKRRGIPSAVVLEHYQKIQKLRQQLQKSA
jgi:hypothetical protein